MLAFGIDAAEKPDIFLLGHLDRVIVRLILLWIVGDIDTIA